MTGSRGAVVRNVSISISSECPSHDAGGALNGSVEGKKAKEDVTVFITQ